MRISLHRFICILFLGVLTLILVPACNTTTDTSITSQKQPVKDCRTVQHVMGSTCIPRNPQRVVTLRPDTLANSLALGIRPIASAYVPGFPLPKYLQGKVDRIESVGGLNTPDIEKILRLKPDLIVSHSNLQGSIYKHLSYIAPTIVLNVPYPPPSWKAQLEELAQVLDKEEVSQQLMDEYWQKVEKLKQALGEHRKIIEVSIANTASESGIWSYGEKHFSGTVLNDVGLQRPESQRGDFFYIENISKENISDINGDVLFFVSWERENDKNTLEKLKQSPLWRQLKVFQRNQVYFVGTHWHYSDIFAINAILDDLYKYLVNTP
jgi:iron complex transport system substrate-binding protein